MMTTTTDKATPRPWYEADDLEVVTRQGFTIASILHDDGFVTNEQASADRALIVRAVNSYDELVEALRVCEQDLSDITNAADNGEPYSLDELAAFKGTAMAHAALAKAEGE